MRLVDDHEADAIFRARAQRLDERRLRESLGRHEHNAAVARCNALQRLALGAAFQRAVHQRAVDAGREQLVRLVLHQRDQRRHDERRAFEMQRG